MMSAENPPPRPTPAWVFVPGRLAPLVPVPPVTATVTLVPALVTVLPSESRTLIWTAGLKREPAAVGPGCTLKASRTAAGGAGPVKKSWTQRIPETSRNRGTMNSSPRRDRGERGERGQRPPQGAGDGSNIRGQGDRPATKGPNLSGTLSRVNFR